MKINRKRKKNTAIKLEKPTQKKVLKKNRSLSSNTDKIINKSDILENGIREQYPDVLEILLLDQTTKKNIFWATDNYTKLGVGYDNDSQILPELITGIHGKVIMPRVSKHWTIQLSRVREMAEVFTPPWICNAQNNLIDNAWFGRKNVFNKEIIDDDVTHTWKTNTNIIRFPNGKSWQDYVNDTRLEIVCGEAPYITSRYDTTTGILISVEKRIGLLDRKLRIINENVKTQKAWLNAATNAFKSIYAFEWQGDSLLLAREAMLFAFIDNHAFKFQKDPSLASIKEIATIISWNVWQMDGLKGVVPNSCSKRNIENQNLFGENINKIIPCEGCLNNNIKKHNGTYCMIMDWGKNEKIEFISLIK